MPGHSNLSELLKATLEKGVVSDLFGVSPALLARAVWQNNIDQDKYDCRLYGDLRAASTELRSLEAQGMATFPALLQDIWAIFYKANPELVPEGRVDAAHRINRPYVERMLEDKTVQEARLTTMLDELSAALATLEAGKRLLEEINQRPELKSAMNRLDFGSEAGEELSEELAAEALQEAQQMLQEAAREVRRAVRAATEAGRDKAQELQAALAGWGLEPGDLQRVPLEQRLELAQRLLRPQFKKLADLVGRFRNLARARQKEKLKKERDELHGITVGADIARVLPAELAMLRHPLRRLDFHRRYTEKQLLQYELRTREPQGRGPIVCLVDASGSMSGDPMAWAVAVALGLVDTAARQRRRAAVILFDTRVLAEYEFAPGERDVEKVVGIATTGTAGGTDYVPALQRAVELIGTDAYDKADVVMITDGVCQVPGEYLGKFLKAKEHFKFRVWSVLVGSDPYGELKRFSDRVWAVRRLTDETAGEIFEEVY